MSPENPVLTPGIDLRAEIDRLRRERQAVILAHYYQEAEIQDLADFVGDSLAARAGGRPDRRRGDRLLRRPLHGRDGEDPEPEQAGLACPISRPAARSPRAVPPTAFARWLENYPGRRGGHLHQLHRRGEGALRHHLHLVERREDRAQHSRRTADRLRARPAPRPLHHQEDRPRHDPLARHLPGPRGLLREEDRAAQGAPSRRRRSSRTPSATSACSTLADHVGSTSSLLKFVQDDPAREFIIVTEPGIIHQMEKAAPGKTFIPGARSRAPARRAATCPHMKRNTLEKLYLCLRDRRARGDGAGGDRG